MPSFISSSDFRSLARLVCLVVLLFAGGGAIMRLAPLTAAEKRNYLMAAVDDEGRLERTAQSPKRFVLLGGSSLGWAVSAKEITERTGVQTVNLGTHAAIGYRLMYKLYARYLKPRRDVIIVSPEIGLIQARPFLTNEYCNILRFERNLSVDSVLCAPINMELFFKTELKASLSGYTDDYRRDGFNSFGDYVFHYNLPAEQYSTPVYHVFRDGYKKDVRAYGSFLEYLRSRGFTVVFIPSIQAKAACDPSEDRYRYNEMLAKNALSDFDKTFPFCMDDKYFFNTDYHMTYAGVQIKTRLFIQELRGLGLAGAPNEAASAH